MDTKSNWPSLPQYWYGPADWKALEHFLYGNKRNQTYKKESPKQ